MFSANSHTFHIPVMGLGYTIDTPIKVARFGISSVVSIIEDELIEQMREFYCKKYNKPYVKIADDNDDRRALRVTAYLDLMHDIVQDQFSKLKAEPFGENKEIDKYFNLLPENSRVKEKYKRMNSLSAGPEKQKLQDELRNEMVVGGIDVNVMTKCDGTAYGKNGEKLPDEFAQAHASLRGFANSKLSSSIIFSAGLNPKLYSYCSTFKDFCPDTNGKLKKKIVLKVSDYRSAFVQGKFMINKGLWISEFRIESGLNCGGHAFPTEGLLMGPILQEFKDKKHELQKELGDLYKSVMKTKFPDLVFEPEEIKVTAQGGIGTHEEDEFLLNHYNLDGTGWGSPFLLVPETTNVDEGTLDSLTKAVKEDYFLSNASPLGIPFNNFRKSTSEMQRKERIAKGKPGSPCYKKFLSYNTEFTAKPICMASRQYQDLKINKINNEDISAEEKKKQIDLVIERDCLCEGLGMGALMKNHIPNEHKLTAVTICPGPNLAYFSKIMTLEEMVSHIYGRLNMRNSIKRPHMFINELSMYVDYLKKEFDNCKGNLQTKKQAYLDNFRQNLNKGIDYYQKLIPEMKKDFKENVQEFSDALKSYSKILSEMPVQMA